MQPEAERRVSQLDADVHEIYGLLRDLRDSARSTGADVMRQGGRLNQIESDLQGIAEAQTDHTRMLGDHTRMLAELGRRLAAQDQKLDRIIGLLASD